MTEMTTLDEVRERDEDAGISLATLDCVEQDRRYLLARVDELAAALQTARKELMFHMRHIDSEILLQDAESALEVVDAALARLTEGKGGEDA